MAFALVQAVAPLDPYEIDGLPRRLGLDPCQCRAIVKTATLILLNADSFASARDALRKELKSSGSASSNQAVPIIDAIKAAMPALEQLWHSGVGLRLQRHDSDVATRVMAHMRRRGVVVLPVHDSFCVPVSAAQLLQETVEAAFDRCLRKLRSSS